LVDQLGLVAALYLYFSRQKIGQQLGMLIGFSSVGVAVAGVSVQSMFGVWGRCREWSPVKSVPLVSSTARPETPEWVRAHWHAACLPLKTRLWRVNSESAYGNTTH